MKFTAALSTLLIGSTAAFTTFAKGKKATAAAPSSSTFSVDNIAGALPTGEVWDPLGFAAKADEATLKRYREAEITHGRVAMLAVVGFLAGEAVEGSSFLWDASVSGPAITHLSQVPTPFWVLLTIAIGASEQVRLTTGWTDPKDVKFDQPGLLNQDYTPGDIGFDPIGLRPSDPEELKVMQSRELWNGRFAMIAAAGFMAQELVDGKGIIEHLQTLN